MPTLFILVVSGPEGHANALRALCPFAAIESVSPSMQAVRFAQRLASHARLRDGAGIGGIMQAVTGGHHTHMELAMVERIASRGAL